MKTTILFLLLSVSGCTYNSQRETVYADTSRQLATVQKSCGPPKKCKEQESQIKLSQSKRLDRITQEERATVLGTILVFITFGGLTVAYSGY